MHMCTISLLVWMGIVIFGMDPEKDTLIHIGA